MKERLKALYFGLLGKQSEAVVVSFWSGEDPLASRMIEEIRKLVPDRRHFVVTLDQKNRRVRFETKGSEPIAL